MCTASHWISTYIDLLSNMVQLLRLLAYISFLQSKSIHLHHLRRHHRLCKPSYCRAVVAQLPVSPFRWLVS